MRAPPSFIRRVIGWQAAAMGALWITLIAALFLVMTRYENGDLDQRMAYFAAILAEAAAGSGGDPAQFRVRLPAVERVFVSGVIENLENARHYVARYQILDRSGRILYATGGGSGQPWAQKAGFGDYAEQGVHFRTVRTDSADGAVTAIVAESDATRWASIWPMLRIIGGAQIIMFLGCIAALWWAATRGMRPIHTMAAAVTTRPPGDLEPLDASLGYRETEPLVVAFNELLARESRRLDSERGFLADAAHELRTPLAALAALAGQLIGAPDEASRRAAATQLEAGVLRISHLLSQLLTTARIDASPAFRQLADVDMAELLRRSLATLFPAARRRAISLGLEAPDAAIVAANPEGLRSIIENLVDNAIRYTPEGGSVLVTLRNAGGGTELTVSDNGPGIPAEFHDAVFERFHRVPGAEAGGSGLGLAIVRRLAQACEATVRLQSGLDGRGLGVVVSFPASRTA